MFADGFATVGPDLGKMSGTMMLALRAAGGNLLAC
jgi:hypothetical protein